MTVSTTCVAVCECCATPICISGYTIVVATVAICHLHLRMRSCRTDRTPVCGKKNEEPFQEAPERLSQQSKVSRQSNRYFDVSVNSNSFGPSGDTVAESPDVSNDWYFGGVRSFGSGRGGLVSGSYPAGFSTSEYFVTVA